MTRELQTISMLRDVFGENLTGDKQMYKSLKRQAHVADKARKIQAKLAKERAKQVYGGIPNATMTDKAMLQYQITQAIHGS